MDKVDRVLALIAARNHGVVARQWAVQAGLSAKMIDSRIASGLLVPMHLGVYRHVAVPPTRETRWFAAVVAAGPGAILSRRAAAVMHGYDGIRRVKPDVTVPYSRLPELAGVSLYRARNLVPADVVMENGIPTMSRARTLMELCATRLPYEVVEHAAQHAVITKKVGVEDLFAILERLGGKGFEGTVMFRSILVGGLPDETIQSMLELLLADIVDRAAVPKSIRQHPLTCADGRQVVLDHAWPDDRIAVEGDGLRWHGTAAQLRKTRARSRSIQNTGWLHLAYGGTECKETPLDVRREIEATHGFAAKRPDHCVLCPLGAL